MTIARTKIIDAKSTRYYHCIVRCVRRADLLGGEHAHRKQWIEQRLEEIAQYFAISVCAYSILDSHVHLLIRLEPELGKMLSDRDVLSRWVQLFPMTPAKNASDAAKNAWVKENISNKKLVKNYRQRLQELGWFMKSLKETISRMANREDDCRGAFWEGRYKSIAVLDEEAQLAISVYTELAPLAAGLASRPETSKWTSLSQRINNAKNSGAAAHLRAASTKLVTGTKAIRKAEQEHWLLPIENASQNSTRKKDRQGMFSSVSLANYIQLVKFTAKAFQQKQTRLDQGTAELFEQLGTSEEVWTDRLNSMLASNDLWGNCFAVDEKKLASLKAKRKTRVDNLSIRS